MYDQTLDRRELIRRIAAAGAVPAIVAVITAGAPQAAMGQLPVPPPPPPSAPPPSPAPSPAPAPAPPPAPTTTGLPTTLSTPSPSGPPVSAIPEPGTAVLTGLGIAGALAMALKKRNGGSDPESGSGKQ